MTGELRDRVCVITGAARGIGAATARSFAREGATVVVADLDGRGAEAAAAEIVSQGGRAESTTLDIADEDAVVAFAAGLEERHGGVDVLVNNAGVSRLGPSMSFPLAEWRLCFDVMAAGTFLCSREVGRVIRDSGGGAIVNISSINGLIAFPMRLAYSAAKAAVVSMTKVLATEWAPYGIRVNAVAPGMIRTEMLQDAIDDGLIDADAYMEHTPLRRFGEVEEIAETVLYLSGERSSYVTGQVLVPDGGWSAFQWIPWSGDPENPGIRRTGDAIRREGEAGS